MKKLKFEERDFPYEVDQTSARETAQEMFDDWYKDNIEDAQVVYGNNFIQANWTALKKGGLETHTARLVDVRAINEKT